MHSVLVTGGAGFIGSNLVRGLVTQGFKVRVLDDLSSGRQANLHELNSQFEFINGNVRNVQTCRDACAGIDTVFHLAALVSVPESVADPIASEAINSGGTLTMLTAARDCGVERFVFSSSAAVYGETDLIPTPENVTPCPLSPYGLQKLTGEHYARLYSQLYGLETVSLRYFNVYGPGQALDSAYAAAIPRFLTALLEGVAPTIYGDGEQTRDFCFVDDIVSANLLAANASLSDVIGTAFNIAGGSRVSLNQLIQLMREVTGSELTALYAPVRAGDIRDSGADITRARTRLGYDPQIDLLTGLRRTMTYYRAHLHG